MDAIYLDTTFAYRTQNIDIMDRYIGIRKLINMIRKYPKGTTFRLLNTTFGFEEVWIRLADAFGVQSFTFGEEMKRRFRYVHHPKDHSQLYVNPVDTLDSLLVECEGNTSCLDTRYQFFIGKEFDQCMVSISASIDLTKFEFDNMYGEKRMEEFISVEKRTNTKYTFYSCDFNYNTGNSTTRVSKAYIQNKETGLFLPLDLRFIFSRHSSCRECLTFISLFKQHVCELYPIVSDVRTWMRGFTMKRYFSFACLCQNFRYDNEMISKYGQSPINNKEKIEIVNYWDYSLLKNEDKRHELEFMGQFSGYKRTQFSEKFAISRLNVLSGCDRAVVTRNRKNAIEDLSNAINKGISRNTPLSPSDSNSTDSQSSKSSGQLKGAMVAKNIEIDEKLKSENSISFHVTCSFNSSATASDASSSTSASYAKYSRWTKFEVDVKPTNSRNRYNCDFIECNENSQKKKRRKLRARNITKIRERISHLI